MVRPKKHNYFSEQVKAIEAPLPEMKKTFDKEFVLLKRICRGKKVLDVGCGIGRPADRLAKFCKEIVCIDNDPKMIQFAKNKLSKIRNAKVFYMDAFNMNFKDNEFDVLYVTYNLLGAVDLKEKFLKEILRVIKKGGILVVFTWKRDKKTTNFLKKYYPHIGLKIKNINENRTVTDKWVFERMDPNKIVDLFKKYGLQDIKIKNIGIWVAVIGRKSKKPI